MLIATYFGAIAASAPLDEAPPELPQLIEGLQGWISTAKGRFLFGDGSSTPGHGKTVHQARNIQDQTALFSQATPELRPTWDAATFDVPCIRSNGSQYLTRSTALAAPGLVIVGCAFDNGSTGFRCLTAARSTITPGGDPSEEAWHLNKSNTDQMRGVVATDTSIHFAHTPIVSGEKLLVMMEVVGSTLQVWQIGSTGEETISGIRIVADGEQALLAKYYNDVITSILEGAIFEFAQYAPAPSREVRRLLVHYFQGLIWPTVAPPLAANVDAGQIEQGATGSVDVISPSSGSSLVLASIDEQPDVGSLSTSGNDVVVNVPPGAALGQYKGQYCLRSDMADARLVDFGQVTFEIIEGASTAASLPEDLPLPPASNILNATTANFDSVYASAAAGNHFVLANGNYGSKTLNRTFSSGNRLVIRAQNLLGPSFTSLAITGNGQIVSGVKIDLGTSAASGTALDIGGSNVRITRSALRNGARSMSFRAGVHDILIDHCEIHRYRDRLTVLADPKDQLRITVARCWIHEMLDGGSFTTCHGFAWCEENLYREKHNDIVVRLNYVGPGFPTTGNSDYIHHKGSKYIYAFNRFDVTSGRLLSARFGLRARYVGNFAPCRLNMYDDLGWYFGNNFDWMRAAAGRSGYYDETKNLANSVGGFHACTRCRIAGNTATRLTLGFDFGTNWCSSGSHPTLPDAMAAGGAKPARSFEGITYASMPAGDGLSIRAHSGTIEQDTGLACITQVQNLNSLPGTSAPAAWLTELLAEYPWIETLCPNPTSLTGGPSGASPWSIAQALTRGDAATPNTGPFRDSQSGGPALSGGREVRLVEPLKARMGGRRLDPFAR